jgi:hypothetical protein
MQQWRMKIQTVTTGAKKKDAIDEHMMKAVRELV